MKWLRRGSRQEETQTQQPQTSNHTSLALNALLQRLRSNRKYNVLDLGSASGVNVDFYSTFASKIYIEDLHRELTSFDYLSPEDGASLDTVFGYLLPYQRGTRFDIIFGWDIFNYLAPDEFLFLSRHLARFCSPGALLFALVSTHESIPEQPCRYTILDEQTLNYRISSTVMRKSPRYEQTQLRQLMPNFRVANSFLLRNGFKEYLFACRRKPQY